MWPFKSWKARAKESALKSAPFLNDLYGNLKGTISLLNDLKRSEKILENTQKNELLTSFYVGVIDGLLRQFYINVGLLNDEQHRDILFLSFNYVELLENKFNDIEEFEKQLDGFIRIFSDSDCLEYYRFGIDFSGMFGTPPKEVWNEMTQHLSQY